MNVCGQLMIAPSPTSCMFVLVGGMCNLVSEGVALDWVLCCQTDAAEQDEEEDEVGEDVVVDNLMAHNPESDTRKKNKQKKTDRNKGTRGEVIRFQTR